MGMVEWGSGGERSRVWKGIAFGPLGKGGATESRNDKVGFNQKFCTEAYSNVGGAGGEGGGKEQEARTGRSKKKKSRALRLEASR